jgi:hypothetical protein
MSPNHSYQQWAPAPYYTTFVQKQAYCKQLASLRLAAKMDSRYIGQSLSTSRMHVRTVRMHTRESTAQNTRATCQYKICSTLPKCEYCAVLAAGVALWARPGIQAPYGHTTR